MNFTKFALLIIGLVFISLITNVHGEKVRKVPGKEIQNADEEANVDPNAENCDGESRRKPRKVPEKEIQNSRNENRKKEQCSKVPPIIVSEPIDDELHVLTIDEYEPIEVVRTRRSSADEDNNRIFEHLQELERLARSASIGLDLQNDFKRHQEKTEEFHRTLDTMVNDGTVLEDKAKEKPKDEDENKRTAKIVNGEDDDEKEIKYQVVLHNGDKQVCGATILDDRYLLSAAHCFIDKQDDPYGEQLYVLIGTNKMSADRANIVKVKTVYVPNIFHQAGDDNDLGDIAVLKLTRELGLGKDPRIAKVELPEPLHGEVYDTYEGKEALIAGFGASFLQLGPTDEYAYEYKIQTASFPKNLVKARVDVLKESECNRIWLPLPMTQARLCGRIKGREHRGVCMGDSGNALVYQNTAIGVVSIAFDLCNEEYQHNGKPTIYTRVSTFKQFIKDAMEDKNNHMRVFDIMEMKD